MILGPWDHGTIGKTKSADVDFGPQAKLDLVEENLAWFDRHLRKKTTAPFPAVRYWNGRSGNAQTLRCCWRGWSSEGQLQAELHAARGTRAEYDAEVLTAEVRNW